jgi:hypothetical protein
MGAFRLWQVPADRSRPPQQVLEKGRQRHGRPTRHRDSLGFQSGWTESRRRYQQGLRQTAAIEPLTGAGTGTLPPSANISPVKSVRVIWAENLKTEYLRGRRPRDASDIAA